jgi:endonuclease-3
MPVMARQSKSGPAARAQRLVEGVLAAYPDARCELDHDGPYQLLVATILSAQCTDKRVNAVTPALFARYPDARSLAKAREADVEELIRSTGFFRSKTRSLLGMAKAAVQRHAGEIPRTLGELVELPGIGRKTANVVLGNAFGVPGVVVDTHVGRIARRLGLTKQEDPEKVERDLMAIVPRRDWIRFSHAMIFHGRRVCVARKPRCEMCSLKAECPFAQGAQRKTR